MNRVAERLVRVAARLLPRAVRDRYREEWLADVAGAAELGVSRASVVVGALLTAITISRVDPALSGLTLGELFTHRVRIAAGLLGSAAVLAVGYTAYGGYVTPFGATPGAGALAVAAVAVVVIAVLLATAGLVSLVGALAVAVRARRLGVAIALLALPLVLGPILIVAPFLLVGVGTFGAPMLAIGLFVGILATARGGAATPVGARLALAGSFGLATLALCAVSILHVAVWNPLARVPDLTLDEIYAALAAAQEATGVNVVLGAQAVLAMLGVVVLLVLVLVPLRRPVLGTARRIVATGFLLLAGTTLVGFVAGFSMGMGLADTFATSGGDAAASGPLLAITGQLALVGALLAATLRPATPRAALLPPPTGPARA